MKKILLFITTLTLTSFTNAAIAQDSVLDFELVQKDLLDKWVEDYGFSNLDALAENGDPVAQRRLGRYYSSVKNDNYTAVKWYKKGAENNDFFAIANLGAMYHNGDGVTKDRYEALKCYKRAFELDGIVDKDILIQSMENLNGIKWTNEYRAGWYLDNAPQGNMLSQFHLASFYEKGYGGLQEDIELAKKWYKKAADQGFKPAIAALINLEDEEFVKVEEIVEVEDGGIKVVNESNLYGVWTVKKLVSKSATIKNIDHIIDEEQYEPLKNALSKSKFIIKADHSFTMIIDYPEFGDYFLDVRWSLDESKIVIVDKPGGPLESEGLLLEIQVEQTGDETIFIMMDGLFYLYVEKS